VIALSAAVAEAIDAVRDQFADTTVDVAPDGAGGAYIVVESIDVAPLYDPPATWLGFHLNATYPASDVYPHYTGPLARTDGQPHGSAIQQVTWRDRPALQLSRRSNRWNPAVDNAALKAQKVLTWLTSQ
jgi:hypothetical protein